MSALLGGVAVLERAISYALGSVALVTPEALGNPTPCRHWDLRDLLEHLHDSMAALHEAAASGRVSGGCLDPVALGEPVVALVRDQAVRLLGTWANAGVATTVRIEGEPISAPLVAGAGAIEVTVHGWDISQACGFARPIPDELAEELLDLAVLFVRDRDRPGRFAPPIEVGADAPAGDRLLAFLGRRPS